MAALARLTFAESAFAAARLLGARLEDFDDTNLLDRVGDLIVDCDTGEQLLGSIDGAGAHPS